MDTFCILHLEWSHHVLKDLTTKEFNHRILRESYPYRRFTTRVM